MVARDFVPPGWLDAPPRLSERHAWVYPVAVAYFQARRHLRWIASGNRWATTRSREALPYLVRKHRSPLLRRLGDTEMTLQHGKVVNLTLASPQVDTLLIRPGETFSFNRIVGNCTARKGYVEGMKLSGGSSIPGVGGGLCQLANLVIWMCLHSRLTIVERSEHSFDPFPDSFRTVPWGIGVSIVYNYLDLVIRNDTDSTYQLKVTVGETHLEGELRASDPEPRRARVRARDEHFVRYGGRVFRRNEIWREWLSAASGDVEAEELLQRNCALVTYEPPATAIVLAADPALDAHRTRR